MNRKSSAQSNITIFAPICLYVISAASMVSLMHTGKAQSGLTCDILYAPSLQLVLMSCYGRNSHLLGDELQHDTSVTVCLSWKAKHALRHELCEPQLGLCLI